MELISSIDGGLTVCLCDIHTGCSEGLQDNGCIVKGYCKECAFFTPRWQWAQVIVVFFS